MSKLQRGSITRTVNRPPADSRLPSGVKRAPYQYSNLKYTAGLAGSIGMET
jgi:hypothetical protein